MDLKVTVKTMYNFVYKAKHCPKEWQKILGGMVKLHC